MLIDTHCHLSHKDYDDLDKIVKNMEGIMIISGCNDKTNKEVVNLVNKYKNVYGTLGIHPEEIVTIKTNSYKFIEDNLKNPKIVAIGEIGLDYHWDRSNIDKQKENFKRQLDIAEKNKMPIVVHSRDATQDTYDILVKYDLKGSVHCFNSSLEMAREYIKIGYKIGVGGVITFKNSKKIQEVVKDIPVEEILLETDSPYLSPEPYRGRKNEPANVYFVAAAIAKLKSMSLEEIINTTSENAIKIFDLKYQK